MDVYKIKNGFVAGWHTQETKNGLLEYYDNKSGKHRKTKIFELIEKIDYCESWFDVTSIARKYGYNVALETANFLTAGILVKGYTKAYINLREKMESKNILQDDIKRAFKAAKIDYWLALGGIGSFDVLAIDDSLNVPDGISTFDYIAANFGENLANAIQAGI